MELLIDTIRLIGKPALKKQSASTSLAARLKIFSGGQTGVDRAALDTAIELGIPHGGWCPKGRLSEDGVIPSQYHLVEMDSNLYADRTRQNIIDSEGTLILYHDRLQGGTLLTSRFAEQQNKPCHKVRLPRTSIRLDSRSLATKVKAARSWLQENKIQTLNIAGPRGSKEPEIYFKAKEFLRLLFFETSKLPLD
ncbi:MAG: putative molybdenum carrier protein [Pirellula sp.]|nr:putative molybdenum carrier protein [Pirellula sp.]